MPATLSAQDALGLPEEPPTFLPDASTTGCGNATNIGTGNAAVLYVDGYPCSAKDYPDVNQPYTNMKICAPGSTTNCQIIDHVIIDSGSDGVRVIGKVLNAKLAAALKPFKYAGQNVTECETYVSSYTYGPIKTADIYIAGKVSRNYPLQVIDATHYPVPTDCSSQGGTPTNDTDAFDGKGLIGVAFPLTDTGMYFNCNSNWISCSQTDYPGIPNLTSTFAADNNGVVMTAPAISTGGSPSTITGTLVFGVGTQSNNKPPVGTVALFNDSASGTFHDSINGVPSTMYIDSGTNVMLMNNKAKKYAECADAPGWFCPANNTHLGVAMWGLGHYKPQFALGYTMGNFDNLSAQGDVAYNDEVQVVDTQSSAGGSDVLGMGNFFGHSMYFVFNGKPAKWPGNVIVKGPINAVYPQK